jgi:hypothetical protein
MILHKTVSIRYLDVIIVKIFEMEYLYWLYFLIFRYSYTVQNENNTWAKQLSNLNSIKFLTVFDLKSITVVQTLGICRQFNINQCQVKTLNIKQLIKMIYTL